jgi:hypothetical protein
VPLVDVEVGVEVVGERVPRDVLPAHPRLHALDVGLRGARDEHERRVARVEVGGVGDLVGHVRAADAGVLGPSVHAGLEEGAVDDQLAAPLEQVEQAGRAVRALEAVLLLHRQPRHPPALGGQRVTVAGQLLLLHQQFEARGLPLLGRHDRGRLHVQVLLVSVVMGLPPRSA